MENIHVILGAPKHEKIKPLLKNEGIIIGVDRGAFFAIEEQIDLDIALGDFDSVTQTEKNQIKKYAKKIVDNPTQDYTDAEVALKYIKDHYNPKKIYIYNWTGGRMDHLYGLLLLVLQEQFLILAPKINFVSTNNYISYYLPGKHEITKIEQMNYLSYILLTEVQNLTLKNVKYPLENADFLYPLPLISNEFLNKKAQFSFKKGIVAVIQSRDSQK